MDLLEPLRRSAEKYAFYPKESRTNSNPCPDGTGLAGRAGKLFIDFYSLKIYIGIM
jgi:hypothetical protein